MFVNTLLCFKPCTDCVWNVLNLNPSWLTRVQKVLEALRPQPCESSWQQLSGTALLCRAACQSSWLITPQHFHWAHTRVILDSAAAGGTRWAVVFGGLPLSGWCSRRPSDQRCCLCCTEPVLLSGPVWHFHSPGVTEAEHVGAVTTH